MRVLTVATDKKQFKVKKHKHHTTTGRLDGGYVVGGIPWYVLYYGVGGYWNGSAPGNDQSPNETAQNGFGQESGSGIGNASDGAGAGDGGGVGSM
jgi:hypothetical protein